MIGRIAASAQTCQHTQEKVEPRRRTFSLQMVWMTSSGGVPSSSVMIENWLTSGIVSGVACPAKGGAHDPCRGRAVCPRASRQKCSPRSRCRPPRRISCRESDQGRARAKYRCALPGQHDFRCSVIPGRHIARHLRVLQPRQAKVADLEIAVLVDEDVGRFLVGRVSFGATTVRGARTRSRWTTPAEWTYLRPRL
jgi:hypothetical protein